MELPTMNKMQNYLVTMLDEANNAFLSMMVRAERSGDAAAHALLFEWEDDIRQDGYKVISVMNGENLQQKIEELNSYEGEVAPRYDLQQFDFSHAHFACD
jgi:hypothetical protein